MKIHCTPQLFKYCIPCQVVPSIVFHVRPLRNESATLTHSFTPSSFARMQLTLFIQLQSIEVRLQGFTQHYKYRWYLVRKCRQWLEFSAGIPHLVTDFTMQIVQGLLFSLCPSYRTGRVYKWKWSGYVRPSLITLKINSTAERLHRPL